MSTRRWRWRWRWITPLDHARDAVDSLGTWSDVAAWPRSEDDALDDVSPSPSALASPAIGPLVALVAVAKLVAHPVALFLAFGAAGVGPDWSAPLLVAAAGPSGAMPFVIALQYGVATETIAKAVLVSTVLSLFTLAALTQTLPG